jgi:hypothetical protein
MKKFFWLITGVTAGLVIAKQIQENPKAQAAVDDATKKAKEFGAAIAEGFKEREAELVASVPASKPKAATKTPSTKPTAKKPGSSSAKIAAKPSTAKRVPAGKSTAAKPSSAKNTSSTK